MKKYHLNLLLVIITTILFLVSCGDDWYKPLIGQPYSGSIEGFVKEFVPETTSYVGINDAFVGLTPSEDAYLFEWAPATMTAKCVYKSSTYREPQKGDGYYKFENIDMDMNSKYILVYKEGYKVFQRETCFVKSATTLQPLIVLERK
jgi:hypothetical protein